MSSRWLIRMSSSIQGRRPPIDGAQPARAAVPALEQLSPDDLARGDAVLREQTSATVPNTLWCLPRFIPPRLFLRTSRFPPISHRAR